MWKVNAVRCWVLGRDSLSCVGFLLCFSLAHSPTCVSCTLSCSSIWFNFREMFIFLSKYTFITLGMALDDMLGRRKQVTMPLKGVCFVHPQNCLCSEMYGFYILWLGFITVWNNGAVISFAHVRSFYVWVGPNTLWLF